MKTHPLSESELIRYERHISLPEIGFSGQTKLKNSRVLLVGVGGLGSSAALYLAAAGVGKIGIADQDTVSLSNLQRQILFTSEQLNASKVKSAQSRLYALNPEIEVETYAFQLNPRNSRDLIRTYDLVIDGTDRFATRYWIHDSCYFEKKPYIYGAIHRFEAQISVFHAPEGPCYRCLYPEPPPPEAVPSCTETGVLGVLPGVVGTLQATEALKLLLRIGTPLLGRLLTWNSLQMEFKTFTLKRRDDCPLCGKNPTISGVEESHLDSCSLEISADEFLSRLAHLGNAWIQLIDVRTLEEYSIDHLANSTHIPLHVLPEHVSELDPQKETVVYCQHGIRSLKATAFLRSIGFRSVRSLAGGIESI